MLTEIEQAALERRRKFREMYSQDGGVMLDGEDTNILADAMLRLYPPGHDAEITPERLVACGGNRSASCREGSLSCVVEIGGTIWAWFTEKKLIWILDGVGMPDISYPRNMGEVWQLLERCGIPVTKGGGQ